MIRFGFGIAIIVLFLSSCTPMFDPGPATKIKAALSPKKDEQAILFQKGGNATESDSYQVSIKPVSSDLDSTEVGNTFTVDNDHGKTV